MPSTAYRTIALLTALLVGTGCAADGMGSREERAASAGVAACDDMVLMLDRLADANDLDKTGTLIERDQAQREFESATADFLTSAMDPMITDEGFQTDALTLLPYVTTARPNLDGLSDEAIAEYNEELRLREELQSGGFGDATDAYERLVERCRQYHQGS